MGNLGRLVLVAACTLFLVGSSQDAFAWVLDFDDLEHGDIVHDQYSAQIPGAPTGFGVTIYADNFQIGTNTVSVPAVTEPPVYPNLLNIDANDLAVLFDSGSGDTSGGDPDLLAPFTDGFGTVDPPKLLIIQENPGDCDSDSCDPPDDQGSSPAGQFIFVFSRPTIIYSIDYFDIEAEEQDPNDPSDIEILLYDNSDNLINTAIPRLKTPFTGDNGHATVDVKTKEVKTVVIEMRGSGAISIIGGDDPVGGEILSVDKTALFLAHVQNNSDSILTVITIMSAGMFGFGLYNYSKRRN